MFSLNKSFSKIVFKTDMPSFNMNKKTKRHGHLPPIRR